MRTSMLLHDAVTQASLDDQLLSLQLLQELVLSENHVGRMGAAKLAELLRLAAYKHG